ncbi:MULTISPECIES: DNA polymerase [unclassified Clostridium]|uniref:DNA polymerase n=1 Tax=unclassified Clostridium TaxID=2614128 RepID=UPI0025BD05EB|nr:MULTISPECIES: DNA polymerase [unclassified Clostridium]
MVNSNHQLGGLIYNYWEIKDTSNGSVSVDTLAAIVHKYEKTVPQVSYIKDLQEYRKIYTLISTYIELLPQKIYKDKRLHGSFNQCDTVTARFASNKPNLQNFPYDARKIIVAPEGKLIVELDFSQIEPRFLNHINQYKDFMETYKTDRGLYSEIASFN